MKYSGIGGQAVMEGVMMRSGDEYATVVRKPDGELACQKGEWKTFCKEKAVRNWPLFRGCFSMVESLTTGMKTLEYSASFVEEDIAQEAKQEEKPGFLEKHFSEETLEKLMMGVAVVLALFMSVGLFMVLPVFIGNLFKPLVDSKLVISLLEAAIRVALFIGYIALISLMKDIRRVFMYHGAEHKCINCIEHGLPLTVENVRASSKEHKRCGTSFLLFVMLVSVFVSIFLPNDNVWIRALTRLLAIPLVVGVSYEFIRLAGRSDGVCSRTLSKPGLWLQHLTTREPEDDMIRVGIASVEAVFDWRAWQKQELGIEYPEEQA